VIVVLGQAILHLQALLDILESETYLDDNGIVSANEIGRSIQMQFAHHITGVSQTPVFSHIQGSKDGDFVFQILSE
jgi:hypothetical protein